MLTRRLYSKRVRDEDGFTLMELLVAMFILVIGVSVVWSQLMTTTVRTSARVQELSTLQTEVRAVVNRLASDLRGAQCNATTTPATPAITTATGTQVTFYSPDRAAPYYHLQQISYQLTNGELDRRFATSANTSSTGPPWTWGSWNGWVKQFGWVTNAAPFTYADASGLSTSDPSAVASMHVMLTVAPHPGLGGGSVTYQTNIDLRASTCF